MSHKVRVRFAPSPTGLLHVGGVRTALFNYLYEKSTGGDFILRIEDTDKQRYAPESVSQIEQSLDWLGIIPDEGNWQGKSIGEHGPYRQSERLEIYRQLAQKLLDEGLAYYSSSTPDDIAAAKQQAIAAKKPFAYKRSMENALSSSDQNKPIRLDTAAIASRLAVDSVSWRDRRRGDFNDKIELLEDFIIIKSDGYPTYNFANVIDDHQMGITHVIRGDEFIASTAKHALLYQALGWHQPEFVHLPAILGPDGKKKLSKRDGDVDVLDFKAKGYLPAALINFLVQLGWNDGTEQEIYSLNELEHKFSLDQIQKSPAVFDLNRLDWMNGVYLRALSPDQFLLACQPYLPEIWQKDKQYLQKVLLLEQERVKKLTETAELVDFFFSLPKVEISLLTAKSNKQDVAEWLRSADIALKKSKFTRDEIEQTLRNLASKLNIKTGQLFYVLRISLTGRTAAPGLFDVIETLGQSTVSTRLQTAIASL